MSFPKRHHFIPQLLLRRFATEQGRLFYFDKRRPEQGIRSGKPQELFSRRHLYSTVDKSGIKDPSLELQFSRIESCSESVIVKLIEAANRVDRPQLTSEERDTWDEFLYFQWKRVPDRLHSLLALVNVEQTIDASLAKFESVIRPLTDDERLQIRGSGSQERIRQNASVAALSDRGPDVQDVLRRMGLVVCTVPKSNKSFIIGSNPVLKLSKPDEGDLRNPEVELWLPISSEIAVVMTGLGENAVQISDRDLRTVNLGVFRQSTVVASRSLDLIRSLIRASA